MPMAPLYERFRELAFREMRSVIVPRAGIVPAGEYGFHEQPRGGVTLEIVTNNADTHFARSRGFRARPP